MVWVVFSVVCFSPALTSDCQIGVRVKVVVPVDVVVAVDVVPVVAGMELVVDSHSNPWLS